MNGKQSFKEKWKYVGAEFQKYRLIKLLAYFSSEVMSCRFLLSTVSPEIQSPDIDSSCLWGQTAHAQLRGAVEFADVASVKLIFLFRL